MEFQASWSMKTVLNVQEKNKGGFGKNYKFTIDTLRWNMTKQMDK